MIFETEGVPFEIKFLYGDHIYIGKKKKYYGTKQRTVTVSITDSVNYTVKAVAYCSPEDSFNKIKGRKIALTKLFKNYCNSNFWMSDKETRKLFWKEYQEQIKYKVN